VLLEGIGDLSISWIIKRYSSIILSQVNSIGLSCFYHISNVPPCSNMYSTYLHWKLLALCMLDFVSFMCLYILCLVCACWFAHHVQLFLLSLLHIICILLALVRDWWFTPFLGSDMLWHSTILKICVHEEYHLVLIFKVYLVSMWYVILMRNPNYIMSINHLVLGFFCLLWNNDLSHYGGVLCFVHITSHENVYI
jgi:hypothetical protein